MPLLAAVVVVVIVAAAAVDVVTVSREAVGGGASRRVPPMMSKGEPQAMRGRKMEKMVDSQYKEPRQTQMPTLTRRAYKRIRRRRRRWWWRKWWWKGVTMATATCEAFNVQDSCDMERTRRVLLEAR